MKLETIPTTHIVMAIWVRVPGTRPDGAGYDFLPAGATRTRPETSRVCCGYFSRLRLTGWVPEKIEIFNFVQLF
jgi:hypothetical protein